MLNQESILQVDNSIYAAGLRAPLYGSYCFSGIPGTIDRLLTAETKLQSLPMQAVAQDETFEIVILLFIDAFGWRFLMDYQDDIPALKALSERALISKLTSQFPSTTANHLQMIHTGQQPCATGIYEYYQYDSLVDHIVAPLKFDLGRPCAEVKLHELVLPQDFFAPPIFQVALRSKGVDAHFFIPERNAPSALSQMLKQFGSVHGFTRPDHAFDELVKVCESIGKNKAYINLYYPDFDALLHRHGPGAKQPRDLAKNLFNLIESRLLAPLGKLNNKAALLICADHGMTDVSPKRTYYLNTQLPELLPFISVSKSGEFRSPSGSPRDFFLHLKPEYLAEGEALLQQSLAGRARIFKTEDLLAAKIFGNERYSERFIQNIGQLLILPEQKEAVWWFEKGIFEQNFFGMHGGLSFDEMDIPFFFLPIS
jgi:predicted AlkP superfamily pyrophosphatase or phosphodiesterase